MLLQAGYSCVSLHKTFKNHLVVTPFTSPNFQTHKLHLNKSAEFQSLSNGQDVEFHIFQGLRVV